MKDHGYSLQANAKKPEGAQHPDRDAQLGYLNAQVSAFLDAGQPVVSVGSKKKENVGTYSGGGAEYAPKGEPEATNTYDLIGEAGKVARCGVYDLAANTGWVNVGTDADSGASAVESIRRWWTTVGARAYPQAKELLVTAGGGGSNGARLRLWKTQLGELAAETGLKITVCHLPPGTSRWNTTEHRMFAATTMSWHGRPLETHEVVVQTIAATTSRTGLRTQAIARPPVGPLTLVPAGCAGALPGSCDLNLACARCPHLLRDAPPHSERLPFRHGKVPTGRSVPTRASRLVVSPGGFRSGATSWWRGAASAVRPVKVCGYGRATHRGVA